jgi:nitrous oxidase accessory protein NosD
MLLTFFPSTCIILSNKDTTRLGIGFEREERLLASKGEVIMRGLATFIFALLSIGAAGAAIIHVPADQPTVQAGVDAAATGDTVLIAKGLYTMQYIEVHKSISLVGENRDSTILRGDLSSPVINLFADGVEVSSLTITWGSSGIESNYHGGHLIKRNLLIENSPIGGVEIRNSQTASLIAGNLISNCSHGIILGGTSGDHITQNEIRTAANGGVMLSGCDNVSVTSNKFLGFVGVNSFADVRICHITRNLFDSCSYGLSQGSGCYDNAIAGNVFSDCGYGIFVSLLDTLPIGSDSFYNNIFESNIIDALDSTFDYWDNGTLSGGNYWDDYVGEDLNGDEFGDTPYSIPGNINLDRYPFMHPRLQPCGDADGSATIDISDAVYLINYVFQGGFPPIPLLMGDANCDNSIDISDTVYLIAYIFSSGPVPCQSCP